MTTTTDTRPWGANPETFRRRETNAGSVIEDSTFFTNTSGWFSWRRDKDSVRTANFKALARQRKRLPINNYSSHTSKWWGTPYTFSMFEPYTYAGVNYVHTWSENKSSVFVHVTYFPRASHVADAANRARAKASKNASGLSVNLAQAFAERKQTAKLLTDTVWRIANAARALKRADLVSCFHYLSIRKPPSASLTRRVIKTPARDRIANHWLELQYGWKPLLQDVHDAAELLAKHIETDPWHSKITGSAKAIERTINYDVADAPYSKGAEINQTSAKYVLLMSLDSTSRSILSQTGISNPALLAWELLPYSFVVDWFIPVGNYLQSLNDFDGWVFVSGYLNQKTSHKYYRTWTRTAFVPGGYSGGGYAQQWTGTANGESFLFSRTVLSSFPTANFPKLKSLDDALNLPHMLNGLSLLTGLFKTRS